MNSFSLPFCVVLMLPFAISLDFRVVCKWERVVFELPQGDQASQNSPLVPTSIAVDGERVFMGLENAGMTVPATLVTFNLPYDHDATPTAPKLQPYPSMEMQGESRKALKNVQALQVDTLCCLWVLDSGRWDDPENARGKVLVFNLRNDLSFTYEFPDSVWKGGISFLADMVLDRTSDDLLVYVADASGGLIVLSAIKNRAWRVQHQAMSASNMFSADGVTTLALSPRRNRNLLYFSRRSSKEFLAVPVSELRSKSENLTVTEISKLPSSVWRIAVDSKGILYFHLRARTVVDSWDSLNDAFSFRENPVYQNKNLSNFPYITFSFDKLENLWMLVKEDKDFKLVRAAIGAKSYIYND
ncbi:uncharacterized protein LOC135943859 [Cloeon dipterum]|uniref:uncharacterized protein LOC135943859 n=1 Tax=Cloeon dipterum TaxID=197152 RepID=UPI00321FC12A